MKKFLGLTRALVVVLAFFAPGIASSATSVMFVGYNDELEIALTIAADGRIGSVAISEKFYQESAKQTKDRIRGLIARTFELGDRAVYIYGSPIDEKLARELLEINIPSGCAPFFFAGKFVEANRKTHPLSSCEALNEISEDDMRSKLLKYDRAIRAVLR